MSHIAQPKHTFLATQDMLESVDHCRDKSRLMNEQPCPCGSEQAYKLCCFPFISGEIHAPTALHLMRSRYSAYALGEFDYIERTMKGAPLANFKQLGEKAFSNECTWTHLEIIEAAETTVEFEATYQVGGKSSVMHERSLFEQQGGQWFYIGEEKKAKPSRNEACPCGSGKKYKRCCLLTK